MRRSKGSVAVAATVVATCAALCGASTASAAPSTLNNYSNGFEANTNGWCDQTAAYGPCDGVSNGTITRVASGSAATYATGISAASGSWYARVTGAPDPMNSACTASGGECFGPYTDYLAGVGASSFGNGFTTTLDIYLDTGFAATHPDIRFDWDTDMNNSSGGYLQAYAFNAGTSPSNAPVWFVNAATNAGRGSSFPENTCPSPSAPPNSCRTPVAITNSGWYRFVHRFFEASDGNLAVEMSIINESNGTTIADWTIDSGTPVSHAGGPFAGYFPNEEISGLPIDNSSLTVTPVGNANCSNETLPPGTYQNVTFGPNCVINNLDNILHDVTGQPGGSLIDQAATIGHDLQAKNPVYIGIGGNGPGQGGSIGHDVNITGVTGSVAGDSNNDNYVCNTQIGHDLVIQNSASTAGQWYVGDSEPECTGGAVQVGDDLNVTKNKNHVDVSENGTNPAATNGGIAGGIADDLSVTGNAAGFVVEGNVVGHDANCNPGPGVTDGDSAPNTAGHKNNGCTN